MLCSQLVDAYNGVPPPPPQKKAATSDLLGYYLLFIATKACTLDGVLWSSHGIDAS
mgnify:CR=1 FL=1